MSERTACRDVDQAVNPLPATVAADKDASEREAAGKDA